MNPPPPTVLIFNPSPSLLTTIGYAIVALPTAFLLLAAFQALFGRRDGSEAGS